MSLDSASFNPIKMFKRRDEVYTFSNKLSPSGDFEKIVNEDVVITTCANILGTRRTSRIMDCSFGSDLVKYCYEPLDDVTEQDIKDEITNSIGVQEERAEISTIEIKKMLNNGLDITIKLSIVGVPRTLHLAISPDAFSVLS